MRYDVIVHKAFQSKLDNTINSILSKGDKFTFSEIWLYGSLARNEQRLTSDIDILIIYESEIPEKEKTDLYCDYTDEVGYPPVQILIRNKTFLNDASYAFCREVNRDKKIIYRRD